jgi:hypothetical protein
MKKISYLMEFIRNRYYLNTSEWNEEFMRKLAYKSGVEQQAVEHMLAVMNGLQRKKWVSDTELIDLNNTIEHFKNNCQ